ncbi:MAG: aminoglycoside phosphotransferase family protein [Geminicoccaceae bacterium]
MKGAPNEILGVLRRGGFVGLDDEPLAEPLTGGVSSDIWRVDIEQGPVCVKRALSKLKVRADWQAPIERNSYEADWMRVVRGIVPEAVPDLLYVDSAASALVMPFLDPSRYRLWKQVLRDGEAEPQAAGAVADRLVRVHAATALRPDIASRFPTDAIFQAIRLEPYLLATAAAHPSVERPLHRIARRTATTKLALVHGDVSPKNILLGPNGPVFLDAECAWYGDPAFDLAFCLNHLLLKCLWTPRASDGFLVCFDTMVETYMAGVVWEPRRLFEARAASLLPALLLARVDGKSPVEYITEEKDRERVRRVAATFLHHASDTLMPIREAWAVELGL